MSHTPRGVSSTPVSRTNIDIDDELIARAMERYGLKTKREAVDLALRRLVGPTVTYEEVLELEGIGYDTDISELRPPDHKDLSW